MRTFPLLLLLLATALPVRAQVEAEVSLDPISKDPDAALRAAEKAAEAAARAKEGARIGFEEILAAPDDVALNMRFARQQIMDGDLRGAASTLERLLMLRPGDAKARLLYGLVLYRLDSRLEADRELERALKDGLSGDDADEARRYRNLIASRARRAHFDARLGFGFNYDDNRNSAPTSDQRLLLDQAVTLNKGSQRTEDTSLQFLGSVGATYDLPGQSRRRLFAQLGYYRAEQTVVDLLDLQAYTQKVGMTWATPWAEFTPTAQLEQIYLSQTSYMNGYGTGLRASRRLRPGLDAWAEFQYGYQKFQSSRLFRTAPERTGDQYDTTLGADWSARPATLLSARLLHRRKVAYRAFNAYRRLQLDLDWIQLLGKGRFALLGVTSRLDRYEQPERAISRRLRSDDAWSVRLMYGTPLAGLWAPLKDFSAVFGVEHLLQQSNLTSYEYENTRLSSMITYKWSY